MRKLVLVLLSFVLLFCACKQDPEPKDVITFTSKMPVVMTGSSIDITNTYKSSYFLNDSRIFNKDLALLSFGMARADVSDAFSKMQFDTTEIYQNTDDYYDRCSYFFAHRKIDDHDLVAVVINWSGYNVEWAGNFQVGSKGGSERADHEGFEMAAEWVYGNLLDYIDTNFGVSNLKLWISGYSRAGAITDALAFKIIEEGEIDVSQENLFAYAFEPSSSIDKGFEQPYRCIHNVVNSPDLVASVPPASWEFARPGIDINISAYPETLNEYLREVIGEGVSMPNFVPDVEKYTTPEQFLSYFIDMMTEKGNDSVSAELLSDVFDMVTDNHTYELEDNPASMKDRQSFYSTIQDRLIYLMQLLMKDDRKAFNLVFDKIKDMSPFELLGLFAKDSLYNFAKPILDEGGIEYVDSELQEGCSLAYSIASNTIVFPALIGFITSDNVSNLNYIIVSHYPEVIYALLKNY